MEKRIAEGMMGKSDSPVLLDTSVFSIMLKRSDSRAALYLPDIQGKLLTISIITVGEVYKWAYTRHWGSNRIRELEKSLQKFIILPVHKDVAKRWARITSIPGRSFSDNDAWIIACAFIYGCVLVTHDRNQTDIPGIKIISHLS